MRGAGACGGRDNIEAGVERDGTGRARKGRKAMEVGEEGGEGQAQAIE